MVGDNKKVKERRFIARDKLDLRHAKEDERDTDGEEKGSRSVGYGFSINIVSIELLR